MKHISVLLILLVALMLAGCGSEEGPSDAEAKEVVYGVYFKDASILEKRQCDLTPKMEEDEQTNVWLIRYEFEDTETEGVMLISEQDSEEYPWMPYMTMAGVSEKVILESCP